MPSPFNFIQPVLPLVKAIGRNFYLFTSLLFFIWVAFFDGNDLLTQFGNYRQLREARHGRAYYQEKIEEVKREREELLSNPKLIEKFAREKYLMKKPTEDIYVVEEQ